MISAPGGSFDDVSTRGRSNVDFAKGDSTSQAVLSKSFVVRQHSKLSPLVGIIMGSQSDWETLQHTAMQLQEFGIPFETQVVSAHRTPDWLFDYAASAAKRGLEIIIAGAGGAAHLPGMTASKTVLPVLGVPVESRALKGLDSLLSIAQMPAGVPVGTLAIGRAGAINAALLAAAILGGKHPAFRSAYEKFRERQTATVLTHKNPASRRRPKPPARSPASVRG